eukprot:12403303-Ditylum_brightwellii.AAC.1
MSKLWQAEIHMQCFDYTAKGQAKFIRFYKNLESLDPSKQQDQKGRATTMPVTSSNSWILRKKKGQEADLPSISTSQARKKTAKYCMLHGNCSHAMNKCKDRTPSTTIKRGSTSSLTRA